MPVSEGWLLEVTSRDRHNEDLARLTPPWHFTPNPRQIDGWHFRNVENTGPHDGSVNAPQELREFVFSPRVGRDIQGASAKARVRRSKRSRPSGHSVGAGSSFSRIALLRRVGVGMPRLSRCNSRHVVRMGRLTGAAPVGATGTWLSFDAPGAAPRVSAINVRRASREHVIDSNVVSLEVASPVDAEALRQLLEDYIGELSTLFAIETDGDGRFRSDKLPLYWTEPDRRFTFFIRSGTDRVGVALATRESATHDAPEHFDVAEFFVLPAHRGRSVVARLHFFSGIDFPGTGSFASFRRTSRRFRSGAEPFSHTRAARSRLVSVRVGSVAGRCSRFEAPARQPSNHRMEPTSVNSCGRIWQLSAAHAEALAVLFLRRG